MVRVVMADDQALLRASLVALLDGEDDIDVVGEAGTGQEAVAVVRRERPDVVLMDLRMPGLDGLAATRHICDDPALARTRVLVLTMFDLDEYVYEAFVVGASGFLLKDSMPRELLDAVRRVSDGHALLAPSITRRLVDHFVATPPVARPRDARLTDREIDVLTLVGRGLSNHEIAGRLVLGVATVKTHVSHLLAKLGARDRVQLVIAAYELRLVTVGG